MADDDPCCAAGITDDWVVTVFFACDLVLRSGDVVEDLAFVLALLVPVVHGRVATDGFVAYRDKVSG